MAPDPEEPSDRVQHVRPQRGRDVGAAASMRLDFLPELKQSRSLLAGGSPSWREVCHTLNHTSSALSPVSYNISVVTVTGVRSL